MTDHFETNTLENAYLAYDDNLELFEPLAKDDRVGLALQHYCRNKGLLKTDFMLEPLLTVTRKSILSLDDAKKSFSSKYETMVESKVNSAEFAKKAFETAYPGSKNKSISYNAPECIRLRNAMKKATAGAFFIFCIPNCFSIISNMTSSDFCCLFEFPAASGALKQFSEDAGVTNQAKFVSNFQVLMGIALGEESVYSVIIDFQGMLDNGVWAFGGQNVKKKFSMRKLTESADVVPDLLTIPTSIFQFLLAGKGDQLRWNASTKVAMVKFISANPSKFKKWADVSQHLSKALAEEVVWQQLYWTLCKVEGFSLNDNWKNIWPPNNFIQSNLNWSSRLATVPTVSSNVIQLSSKVMDDNNTKVIWSKPLKATDDHEQINKGVVVAKLICSRMFIQTVNIMKVEITFKVQPVRSTELITTIRRGGLDEYLFRTFERKFYLQHSIEKKIKKRKAVAGPSILSPEDVEAQEQGDADGDAEETETQPREEDEEEDEVETEFVREYDLSSAFSGPPVKIRLENRDYRTYDDIFGSTPSSIPQNIRDNMTLMFVDPSWGVNTDASSYGGIDLEAERFTR